LVLSDPVITDQLSAVSFQFDKNESDLLRKHISRLAELPELQLDLIENEIRANTNSLLG
jgi:Tat protein secretion system quality control protein TatD with DNase activity